MVAPRHPLARHVDADAIRTAIESAVAGTNGTIMVTLDEHGAGDIVSAARYAFARLRLHVSELRNNVLLYVWPKKRQFAVVGDAGIHDRLGQVFWDDLARSMSERIKSQDLTAGLVLGVKRIGTALQTHFPAN